MRHIPCEQPSHEKDVCTLISLYNAGCRSCFGVFMRVKRECECGIVKHGTANVYISCVEKKRTNVKGSSSHIGFRTHMLFEKVKCHVNAVTSRLRAVFVVWWGRGALKNDIYLLNN